MTATTEESRQQVSDYFSCIYEPIKKVRNQGPDDDDSIRNKDDSAYKHSSRAILVIRS